MQGARGEVEGAGVEQKESAFAGGDGGEFGKADVVADGEGDEAVRRQRDEGEVATWREHVGFAEGNFSRDVDVEKVDFTVGGH